MNKDDYESLPTTNFGINMTAGAMAGVLEHCVMYPMDSVKTRMQSLSPATSSFNIVTTMRNMIKLEGLARPIRGITVVVAGAGPAHALHFGCYEKTKELLTKFTSNSNVNYMISGIIATVIHDAVSNPTDVIKQRMQMYNSPYKSVVSCMRDVYQREGFRAFYRSYSTQLVMNVPYNAIHFSVYECFQNLLNQERRYNPLVHVMAGGASGACAAAVTTPLDVIKTTLNTQETGFTNGMSAAIKRIYTLAGPFGFFKGLTARVLYSMPATAICWSTYEFFKFYLAGIDRDLYKSSITGKSQLMPREPKNIGGGNAVSRVAIDSDINVVPYVLPNATAATTVGTTEELTSSSNSNTASVSKETTSTTHSNATHTTIPSITTSTGSTIKSVCELSAGGGAGATSTLNLHTRHTDVKNPFDCRYSS